MENAVEALKIAFAVMMFIVALTLSISSFSQATSAVDSIIDMSDRENEYTYVTASNNLTRTVGIETIVPAMYRAYKEEYSIYFYDENGNPLALYYKTDNYFGDRVQENYQNVKVNYVDLELEELATSAEAIAHLDLLLGDLAVYDGKYKNQIIHNEGLYEYLSQYRFEEKQGEYYEGTGATKTKKRVITYTIVNE